MNWYMISFVALVFVAVIFLVMGAESVWNTYWSENTTNIENRLKVITGELHLESLSLVKTRQLSQYRFLNKLLLNIPNIDKLDVFLTQAGLSMNVGTFLLRLACLTVLSLGVAGHVGLPFAFMFLSIVLPSAFWLLYLQSRRRQRVFQIENQLPDTLDLMARAMQAGHAFSSALLMVGSEGTAPIKNEFQTTFNEINFGISTEIALHHLTHRVASSDLRFFVVAVLIQLETGGNLTEILKSLSSLIRDRQRIAGTVRVLTAEGRLSAWILGILPFAIGGILSIVNPEFIAKLWTDPTGIRMLEFSFILMSIGIWWMWRMIRIEI